MWNYNLHETNSDPPGSTTRHLNTQIRGRRLPSAAWAAEPSRSRGQGFCFQRSLLSYNPCAAALGKQDAAAGLTAPNPAFLFVRKKGLLESKSQRCIYKTGPVPVFNRPTCHLSLSSIKNSPAISSPGRTESVVSSLRETHGRNSLTPDCHHRWCRQFRQGSPTKHSRAQGRSTMRETEEQA